MRKTRVTRKTRLSGKVVVLTKEEVVFIKVVMEDFMEPTSNLVKKDIHPLNVRKLKVVAEMW